MIRLAANQRIRLALFWYELWPALVVGAFLTVGVGLFLLGSRSFGYRDQMLRAARLHCEMATIVSVSPLHSSEEAIPLHSFNAEVEIGGRRVGVMIPVSQRYLATVGQRIRVTYRVGEGGEIVVGRIDMRPDAAHAP